jgi:hypothetical protein
MRHRQTRENDEYACSCGLRWGIREEDPHPRPRPRRPRPQTLLQLYQARKRR